MRASPMEEKQDRGDAGARTEPDVRGRKGDRVTGKGGQLCLSKKVLGDSRDREVGRPEAMDTV